MHGRLVGGSVPLLINTLEWHHTPGYNCFLRAGSERTNKKMVENA